MNELPATARGEIPLARALEPLVTLLAGRRIVALTGAGVSTESGIPDYRGPGTRRRARNPIQYKQFVRSEAWRRRYWARSMVGWPWVDAARPNPAHRALADLEAAGVASGLITQNVDRLHHRAGSRQVIELHGALAEVVCLDCGAVSDRGDYQARLALANPGWAPPLEAESAPDGDAELEPYEGFVVPGCARCGGALKPRVVFFGESVPRPTVEEAAAWVDAAEGLLVVGSSLAVFSGWRFVRQAHKRGVPVGLLNLGETRADPIADVKVEARVGSALPALVDALTRS